MCKRLNIDVKIGIPFSLVLISIAANSQLPISSPQINFLNTKTYYSANTATNTINANEGGGTVKYDPCKSDWSKKRFAGVALAASQMISHRESADLAVGSGALRFTDTTYIDLGDAPELKLTNFTLEAWIKIEGYGSTTGTGSGGLTAVVPVISKGRDDAETALKDVNYFLGYELATNKLVADFEDEASLNHPVTSNASIPNNTWTHIGASFDVVTKTWRLFINTSVELFTLSAPAIPQSGSAVSVCIGSTLNDANLPVRPGFFNGRIDEVRIWNIALSSLDPGELLSAAGLAGRWGLGDAAGTGVLNTVSGGADGAIVNNYEWVTGFNEPDPASNSSIDFNGVHDYITFGPSPSLNTTPASTGFTLEALIKIEGTGTVTSTGIDGLPAAIPVIAKGADESDLPANLNMNYFFGINSSNVLVADFEEAAGANTGLNHPVTGTTTILNDVWTHVAATYNVSDGAWKLYVDGVLAGTGNAGAGTLPEYSSIQHASIGSALTSNGVSSGYFNGKIDEVSIWNRALSASELKQNNCGSLTGAPGLLGHWDFNENGDISAANSVTGGANGSLISNNILTHPTNGGPSWANKSFNEYRSKNATGTWSVASGWEVFNGSTWLAATKPPGKTDNVTILAGTVYTITGPVSCNDLTVNSGGQLLRNISANTYISIYGNILCDGIIGNGAIPDGISFSIEGAVCAVSGSGTFDCSRVKKSCNEHTTTSLTFYRDVNLRYNGTALFNDVSSTFFDIMIAPGITVNCPGDGTPNSGGSVAIDGTDGTDFGYNAGSLTIGGTLNLFGTGTAVPTLYLTNNNTNVLWPVSITITQTGTINTGSIDCSSSGAAGHSFTILSGGKLNITGEPGTYATPSLVNNSYTFQPGSTIEYSAPGDQTVYTFGFINYSNLFASGSGIKTIAAPLGVTDTVKLTGIATLASGGNLTLLSTAAKTAMVAELPVNSSGAALANITGDVIAERYISARRAWRFLSVPTNTSQTVKAAWQEGATSSLSDPAPGFGTQVTNHVPSTPANGFDYDSPAGPSVKKYDITATGIYAPFRSITTTFDAIATREGIMTFIRGDRTAIGLGATATSTVLRTRGTLYTGALAPVAVPANQFASIGNPYASPVDMRKILKTPGVNDNYYLWDPRLTGSGFGAFQTFTLIGSDYVPTPGGGSYPVQGPRPIVVPYNYIQSGMAFFKEASGNTGGSVLFTESAKANSDAVIGNGALRPASSFTTDPLLRANLYAVEGDSPATLVDGVLVDFGDYSNIADKSDARKMPNVAENLAVNNGNILLAVEKRSYVIADDTIQLHISNMKVKSYRLEILGSNFIRPELFAILEDSYLNTRSPVDINGSTLYNFSITNARASRNTGRFSIVFTQLATVPITFTSIKAFRLEKDINVEWEVENEINSSKYVVEKSKDGIHFTEQVIINAAPGSGTIAKYQWTDINPATKNNYYRIRSVGYDGETRYSKVVKVVIEQEKSRVIVFPNPVKDGTASLQFINQAEGTYTIRVLTAAGRLLTTKQIKHTGSNSKHLLPLNTKSMARGVYNLEIIQGGKNKTTIKLLL